LDDFASELLAKFNALGPRELLALDGSIVADHRGRTAWRSEVDRWHSVTIDRLGGTLPHGYRWGDDLSAEDAATIACQRRSDQIRAMSPDERRAYAEAEISTALDELARQYARAQICGDTSALGEIRAMYGGVCEQIRAKYEVQDDGQERQERQPSRDDGCVAGDPS
jgi:hypothetical protein